MNSQYITKSDLAQRWSLSLIDKYFPICSQEKPNPRHKRGAPMQLYDVAKVRRIESMPDFKTDMEKVLKNKIAALERAQKRREKLIEYANGVQIHIPTYEKEELVERACKFYNASVSKGIYSSQYGMATPSREEPFLKRIASKYLECECTFCNEEINTLFDKIRKDKAYDILQQRINDAIKQKYEWLR